MEKLRNARDYCNKYDELILDARKVYAKEKALPIFKSRPIPDGMETTPSLWRTRQPDGFDVERLLDIGLRGRHLDPRTEEPVYQRCQRKAKAGELTKQEYWHLAFVLFNQRPIL